MEFKQEDLSTAIHWLSLYGNSENFIYNSYWVKRITDRLNQLNPLISELDRKGLFLIDVSKELNNEYNTLNLLKIQYKL